MSDLIKSLQKESKYYPLTHPQLGIWNVEKMYSGTSISNIAGTVRIVGEVKYDLLEKAINLLIEKNDALRIRIMDEADQPRQFVSEYSYKNIDMIDFSKFENPLEALYKWDEEQTRIPFNLFQDELFYFALIKLNNNDGGYYLKLHHMITDAWSMALVVNRISEFYNTLVSNSVILSEKQPSYIDYINSENQYLNSERFLKDKEYWNEKFKTFPEITYLKTKKTNQIMSLSKRKTLVTPIKFANKLRDYCHENKTTPYTLFVSALCMYISRVSSKEEIVIGTPILNRCNKREKDTMGMFVNTEVMRIMIDSNMNFKAFSENVARESMALLRHQKYPYDLLLKETRSKYNTSENLFDIALSYQNSKLNLKESENDNEHITRWHFNGHQTNSLTIHINDREDEGRLIIDYDFHEDLFYVKEIEFIHKYLISLLWHSLDNPDKKICNIEMLPESEKQKLLYEFNNTYADYPKDKTIHQLFEEQVERTPDNIALVFEGQKMTYRQLNEKSNQLAWVLRQKGVKPDQIVGIMVNRSFEMVIGILAILKAGGAYLPIDNRWPNERKKFIFEDSCISILLIDDNLPIENNLSFNEIININDSNIYVSNSSNLENLNETVNLSYIMYTSGSTGDPKGVMVTHKNVINLSFWFDKKYSLYKKNVINIAEYSFDVSIEEIIISLLNSATVFIPTKDIILDRNKFIQYMNFNNINIAQFVPTLLRELLLNTKKIESLNVLISGGEVLNEELKNIIIKKGYNIYNHYGPTECTVDALVADCSLKDKVTLGKPINNTKCFILDKNLNLLPIGVPGELYISGDGVALGYLNKNELTNQRFINNPFDYKSKLYKTGDIARWYIKGDIEFLGRADQQVKIKGYRIELEEIEKALKKIKNIQNAIVAMKENIKNAKIINAYIVTNRKVNISIIRNYLKRKLPEYMIPNNIIVIDKLPLTDSGKVNKNELPNSFIEITSRKKYEKPRNEIDRIIKYAWENALKIHNIGINDNFFDLGGDSLTIIEVLVHLFPHNFNIKSQDFYQYPSIKLLSNKIRKNNLLKYNENNLNYIYPDDLYINKNECELKTGNIFLTGSTSILGIHILNELLSVTPYKIYCLVRAKNKIDAKNRLINALYFNFDCKHKDNIDKRIIVVNGDISKDYLSLNNSNYNHLGKNISLVLHTASLSKPYGHYSEYNSVNINGTKNIVKFCNEFNLSLSYISSITVSGNYIFNTNLNKKLFTENNTYIGQDYISNLFVYSKFIAEQIILEAVLKTGLNANIIRIGDLSGRYSDGNFQYNITKNALYSRIKSIIELRAIPRSMTKQTIYLSPVDSCSKAIVCILNAKRNSNRIFHVFNHNSIKIEDFILMLKDINININILNDKDFSSFITDISKNNENSHWLNGIINDFNNEKVLSYESSIIVDSTITQQYLLQNDFIWNKIDKHYINKIINYMNEVSFV